MASPRLRKKRRAARLAKANPAPVVAPVVAPVAAPVNKEEPKPATKKVPKKGKSVSAKKAD